MREKIVKRMILNLPRTPTNKTITSKLTMLTILLSSSRDFTYKTVLTLHFW